MGASLIATCPETYTRFGLAAEDTRLVEPYRFPLKDLKKWLWASQIENLKETQVLFLLNKKLIMKLGVVAHVCL